MRKTARSRAAKHWLMSLLVCATAALLVGGSSTALLISKAMAAEAQSKIYLAKNGISPIAQRGQDVSSPIPYERLVPLPEAADAPVHEDGVIDWTVARQHVGKEVVVQGQVIVTNNRGSVCFVNFTRNWRGKFYVIIFDEAYAGFPESPDTYLKGRTIQVSGKVEMHRGSPQIQVHRASQIKVLE